MGEWVMAAGGGCGWGDCRKWGKGRENVDVKCMRDKLWVSLDR